MEVAVNEVFFSNIQEEGTVMDYVDGAFVFVLKDEMWTEHEIKAVRQKPLQVDFVFKYDIPIFLLTIEDAIDTSDFIFNVHDGEYPDNLYEVSEHGCKGIIYLLDKQNIVCGKRVFIMSKALSSCIVDSLIKQKNSSYYEEEFNCNLDGLQSTWEPFELQEFALESEIIK